MKILWMGLLLSGLASAGGVSEEETNKAIEKVTRVYAPILMTDGIVLTVANKYTDATVNGYSQQIGNHLKVTLFGGLVKHPTMTPDAVSLVVCKEIGNHVGGAPKAQGRTVSINGQADYYSTLKCLKRVFQADDNIAIVRALEVPQIVLRSCGKAFSDANQAAVCVRSSLAGRAISTLFSELQGVSEPRFETPDQTVVASHNVNHAGPQCRLDTYFRGALCNVSSEENVSQNDEVTGTCHSSLGLSIGQRPTCWFKE